MKAISEIEKKDLEGRWINKYLIGCEYFDNNPILYFSNGKVVFNPIKLDYIDYQLEFNEQTGTLFLNFKNGNTIEIWQLFPDIDKESMIIKIDKKKYYFERLS